MSHFIEEYFMKHGIDETKEDSDDKELLVSRFSIHNLWLKWRANKTQKKNMISQYS